MIPLLWAILTTVVIIPFSIIAFLIGIVLLGDVYSFFSIFIICFFASLFFIFSFTNKSKLTIKNKITISLITSICGPCFVYLFSLTVIHLYSFIKPPFYWADEIFNFMFLASFGTFLFSYLTYLHLDKKSQE